MKENAMLTLLSENLDQLEDKNIAALRSQINRLVAQLELYFITLQRQLVELSQQLQNKDDKLSASFIKRTDIFEKLASLKPSLGGDIVPIDSKLGLLEARLQLSAFERDALLLCVMPLFDEGYSQLFSVIDPSANNQWPTVGLILRVLCWDQPSQTKQHLLQPQAPLLKFGLVKASEKEPSNWNQVELKIDQTIYNYLLGYDNDLSVDHIYCRWLEAPRITDILPDFTERLAPYCVEWRNSIEWRNNKSLICLQSPLSSQGETALLFAAKKAQRKVLAINLAQLANNEEQIRLEIRWALREASLHVACVLFQQMEVFAELHANLLNWLADALKDHWYPVFYLAEPNAPIISLENIPQLRLTVPAPNIKDEVELLSSLLEDYWVDDRVNVEEIVRRFHPSPHLLIQILAEADTYRKQRNEAEPLTTQDLYKAFKQHAQQAFGKLAKRIEPVRDFNDLIIAEDLQEQIDEVLAAIRQREHLLSKGFAQKIGYGTGVSALFYGDSGTGKTMVAEVLAKQLGVDLIKVDLSTVVNKYIGETEKNLSRIFDHAEKDAGVLFFDEADALFGKRSETKDAHDRHANIEVSYLLQRLEEYPGLVVLATNHRTHLDEAFTRRLTFIIRFPFPDAELREKMWRAIWPKEILLADDIDFAVLAKKSEITGANIKNIALLAAWLAADKQSKFITTEHIELALQRELTKLGRINLH